MPCEKQILYADPAHHESAYFSIKNFGVSVTYSDSENSPVKDFIVPIMTQVLTHWTLTGNQS